MIAEDEIAKIHDDCRRWIQMRRALPVVDDDDDEFEFIFFT